MEKHQMAVLSTGALTWATMERLERYASGFPFIVAPFEEGVFVSCQRLANFPEEVEVGQLPEDLVAAMRWAIAGGCEYLLLDRDAELAPELPEYEWNPDGTSTVVREAFP